MTLSFEEGGGGGGWRILCNFFSEFQILIPVQYNTLSRRFRDLMAEYNQVQEEYREKCKDRIQRQLKYSGFLQPGVHLYFSGTHLQAILPISYFVINVGFQRNDTGMALIRIGMQLMHFETRMATFSALVRWSPSSTIPMSVHCSQSIILWPYSSISVLISFQC